MVIASGDCHNWAGPGDRLLASLPIWDSGPTTVIVGNFVKARRGKSIMPRFRIMPRACCLLLMALLALLAGKPSLQSLAADPDSETGKKEQPKEEQPKEDAPKKGPKTLFDWTLFKTDDDKKNGKDKDGQKDKENGKDDKGQVEKEKQESNDDQDKDEESKRIDPDRPHLPESSSTVGLGRTVLECGYTYNTTGGFFPLHSFPEALLRVGIFADWFELRIAQNIENETITDAFGVRSNPTGATDLQLGVKLALTEQQKCLPESCIIFQMTVPSGSKDFTAERVLPGCHYDASWEIIKDKLSVETVLLADGSVDDHGHTFTLMGDGITVAYDVTKKLEAFGELDSFYASGDSAAPQHYFVGGLVYFFTNNCEIDFRAGVGLNQHAEGYLLGTGFAIRF
jgi:hypothetical protein